MWRIILRTMSDGGCMVFLCRIFDNLISCGIIYNKIIIICYYYVEIHIRSC